MANYGDNRGLFKNTQRSIRADMLSQAIQRFGKDGNPDVTRIRNVMQQSYCCTTFAQLAY
jgi:hypothetical protein